MRNIAIIFWLLLVFSCKSSINKEENTFELNGSLKDGRLNLKVNNTTQLLKEEGDIVGFHSSKNKKEIALEVEKLSTLSIIKLYKWDSSFGKYVADTAANINRKAWQSNNQIQFKDLESSLSLTESPLSIAPAHNKLPDRLWYFEGSFSDV